MSLKTVSPIELGLLDMDNVSKLYEISVRGHFEAYLQYINYDINVCSSVLLLYEWIL